MQAESNVIPLVLAVIFIAAIIITAIFFLLKLIKQNPFNSESLKIIEQNTDRNTKTPETKINADEVIQHLSDLNYFKYVPAEELEEAKQLVRKRYIEQKSLIARIETDGLEPLDNLSRDRRYYFTDQEDLCEGGIDSFLKELHFIFKAEGVAITYVNNDIQNPTQSDYIYNIFINDKKYSVINTLKNPESDSWTEAQKRTYGIINELLSQAGSGEKIFPLCDADQRGAIILTEELFNFFRTLRLARSSMPFHIEDIGSANIYKPEVSVQEKKTIRQQDNKEEPSYKKEDRQKIKLLEIFKCIKCTSEKKDCRITATRSDEKDFFYEKYDGIFQVFCKECGYTNFYNKNILLGSGEQFKHFRHNISLLELVLADDKKKIDPEEYKKAEQKTLKFMCINCKDSKKIINILPIGFIAASCISCGYMEFYKKQI